MRIATYSWIFHLLVASVWGHPIPFEDTTAETFAVRILDIRARNLASSGDSETKKVNTPNPPNPELVLLNYLLYGDNVPEVVKIARALQLMPDIPDESFGDKRVEIGLKLSGRLEELAPTSVSQPTRIYRGEGSLAYRLACLDRGKIIEQADPEVKRYQDAIDVLVNRYGINEVAVVNETWVGLAKLRIKKVDTSAIEIMEEIMKVDEFKESGVKYNRAVLEIVQRK